MIDRNRTPEMAPWMRDHEEWLAEQEREKEERRKANEEARAAYLKRLDERDAAKRQETEAARDVALAPAKERAKRQWLYERPGMTEADFEKLAWPYLRANLLEDERDTALQREIEAQRARMRGF